MGLSDYRKRAGKTQKVLAEEAHVSRETIVRIESGDRRPSPAVAEKIREALGMDVATMWKVLYETEHIDVGTEPSAREAG
jgi:DNA-binding XRE family transcriptional regulator